MGVNRAGAAFLLTAKQSGVSFERTLTLGRQDLYDDRPVRPADDLFRDLGASTLDALDNSAYEGATIIHDLNKPVPKNLRAQYSVVFDGGTLEHIFDAPAALRHALALVAPGGHYIAASPGNNQMGHGFYQFSPEFYYRALAPEAGFCMERLLAVEQRMWSAHWYRALDPEKGGRRYQLRTNHPVELFVQAQRLQQEQHTAPTAPQQSDYVAAWNGAPPGRSIKGRIRDVLPRPLVRLAEPVAMRRRTSWSTGGFTRIKKLG